MHLVASQLTFLKRFRRVWRNEIEEHGPLLQWINPHLLADMEAVDVVAEDLITGNPDTSDEFMEDLLRWARDQWEHEAKFWSWGILTPENRAIIAGLEDIINSF
jgi:hypothetical protein